MGLAQLHELENICIHDRCRVSARQPSFLLGASRRAPPLLIREIDPKPLTPRPASFNEVDASHGRAGQLAALTQGPPVHEERTPRGPGGRRRGGGRTYHLLGKSMVPFTAWIGLSPAFISRSATRVGHADTHAWGIIWKDYRGKLFIKSCFGQE